MSHFNGISVINNETITNLSGDFGLQGVLQELYTQSKVREETKVCAKVSLNQSYVLAF